MKIFKLKKQMNNNKLMNNMKIYYLMVNLKYKLFFYIKTN